MSLDSSYQLMLLETERLVLRPYEEGDIDEMHRIWMDPDVKSQSRALEKRCWFPARRARLAHWLDRLRG